MSARNLRLVCFVAASTIGCTLEYPLGQTHQSNFTYPESQVTPLQNVYGEATESAFGTSIQFTGQMKEEAIDDALGQVPGANVLLNYNEEVKIFMLPVLPVYTTTYSVQGMAAEAEVR
jgi:hypothetical protein